MVFNLSDPLHTTNFFHIQYLIEKKLAHISFTLKIDFIELCDRLSTNSFFYQKLKLIEWYVISIINASAIMEYLLLYW